MLAYFFVNTWQAFPLIKAITCPAIFKGFECKTLNVLLFEFCNSHLTIHEDNIQPTTIKALGVQPCAFICFSVFVYPDETLTLVLEIILDSRVQKVMSAWPPESCDPLKAPKYNLKETQVWFPEATLPLGQVKIDIWAEWKINDNFQSETISTLKNTKWVESSD